MVQNQNKNMNRIFGNVLENLKANFRIITITKASKTNYTQSTNSVDEAQHESLCRNEVTFSHFKFLRSPIKISFVQFRILAFIAIFSGLSMPQSEQPNGRAMEIHLCVTN